MCFWILMIVLLLMLIGSFPAYPYSRRWGYYPSGTLVVLLIVLFALWWLSYLPWWGRYPHWWG